MVPFFYMQNRILLLKIWIHPGGQTQSYYFSLYFSPVAWKFSYSLVSFISELRHWWYDQMCTVLQKYVLTKPSTYWWQRLSQCIYEHHNTCMFIYIWKITHKACRNVFKQEFPLAERRTIYVIERSPHFKCVHYLEWDDCYLGSKHVLTSSPTPIDVCEWKM